MRRPSSLAMQKIIFSVDYYIYALFHFQDLTSVLEKELGGEFRDLSLGLMKDESEFDVETVDLLSDVSGHRVARL
jgi:hypothetical protein